MKYCRFVSPDGPRFGLVETLAGSEQITQSAPDGPVTDFSKAQKVPPLSLATARLLYPAVASKIVCVGRNYSDHAKELGNEVPSEPLIFLKPPSSLISPGEPIVRPKHLSQRVDFEGELTVVIGKKCRGLKPGADVKPYILGYTCANDVSARDIQFGDIQVLRGKSLDTFCPLGPWIVTGDEIPNPNSLKIKSWLNGRLMQDSNTNLMIFSIPFLVSFLSQYFTLVPGDIILTGTPRGVGVFRDPPMFMKEGDEVTVEIERIGRLVNTCRTR